jgi:hypothetical protein
MELQFTLHGEVPANPEPHIVDDEVATKAQSGELTTPGFSASRPRWSFPELAHLTPYAFVSTALFMLIRVKWKFSDWHNVSRVVVVPWKHRHGRLTTSIAKHEGYFGMDLPLDEGL